MVARTHLKNMPKSTQTDFTKAAAKRSKYQRPSQERSYSKTKKNEEKEEEQPKFK